MRLRPAEASTAQDLWEADPQVEARAEAHNLAFEERVSSIRQGDLDAYFASIRTPRELRGALIEYWRQEVILSDAPAPFRAGTGSGVANPSGEQKIIRLETLSEPLEKTGITFDALRELWLDSRPGSARTIEWFFKEWNTRSDIRKNPVSFATFKDQHISDLNKSDWAIRLRDRLGLAHYDATSSVPIPVALMEYEVNEVTDHCRNLPGVVQPFAVPAVVDLQPYCYFYPTPHETAYGCPMSLQPIQSEADLVAELLHPRIPYGRQHLKALALIDSPIPRFALDELRNNHLLAIRLDSRRDDFGGEI